MLDGLTTNIAGKAAMIRDMVILEMIVQLDGKTLVPSMDSSARFLGKLWVHT
jgi:hypothetical protein